MTLGFKRAGELARMISAKEISAVELTRFYIDRIERLDGPLNAVVVRDFDRARKAAEAADLKFSRGEPCGPLHGIPVTVKEGFDVAGLPTTWGVPSYREHVAAEDAVVVKRLKAAGAIVLGKTNVPHMLGDFQSYNEIHGVTNNPWDPARTPGGSSGGGAAALAAGLTALEAGSDAGGSIRNPAHYCGVYGHKPTWGAVPLKGHNLPSLPPPRTLAVAGPLARSAEDLALGLQVMTGKPLPPAPFTSLKGLRVAVWPDEAVAPVATGTSDRVQAVAEALGKAGAVVSDSARPNFDPAEERATFVALLRAAQTGRPPEALAVDSQARIIEQWELFFEDHDLLICPIMATTAFAHDHGPLMERLLTVNGASQPYFRQVFWASLATVAHLPATVFPTGLLDGLPLGLQAIGPLHGDHTTIAFARLFADVFGGFSVPKAGPASPASPE